MRSKIVSADQTASCPQCLAMTDLHLYSTTAVAIDSYICLFLVNF